jgi:hypothetical protein
LNTKRQAAAFVPIREFEGRRFFVQLRKREMEREYHIRKRAFLLNESDSCEHAVAIVERSGAVHEAAPELDWYVTVYLKIATDSDAVNFFFDLGTPETRAESLERIRTLSDLISDFRSALECEVEEVEARNAQESAEEVYVN